MPSLKLCHEQVAVAERWLSPLEGQTCSCSEGVVFQLQLVETEEKSTLRHRPCSRGLNMKDTCVAGMEGMQHCCTA